MPHRKIVKSVTLRTFRSDLWGAMWCSQRFKSLQWIRIWIDVTEDWVTQAGWTNMQSKAILWYEKFPLVGDTFCVDKLGLVLREQKPMDLSETHVFEPGHHYAVPWRTSGSKCSRKPPKQLREEWNSQITNPRSIPQPSTTIELHKHRSEVQR